ncbi:protoporphyrinogen/coproporphyrinogen oxidase [Deinococcus cellulosilyticus]|uniref:Oxidoreductase FAD-binding protein n=1 Tax=Deinococcus cellulosilyticus (strain DSM 18568 / NBRC 106333 / KACC 11606 / 5516J-15) TaxID=1223518 RepID=A0A511N3X7_DEIC1|nr:NAD(P)/FAD-dependent oxidoreductase [Deinococcus cellulosilyticus]GEM47570.1 oxidoreductase FAD-binding protein [Deinococcus cellulosilyticus NBRC 106333 = KACC 11606]
MHVIVIGAGLAGLTAARILKRAGKQVTVLEKSDHVGGRVCTSHHQGFTIDHGFQVLFTGYPAVKRNLNLEALDLRILEPGAVIRSETQVSTVGDPLRLPGDALKSLQSPHLSLKDKALVGKLSLEIGQGEPSRFFREPETSTLVFLQEQGFSEGAIESFFKPFFGGIFLKRDLSTSSRLFRYYYRMMLTGEVAIPREGMQAIPQQLAKGLNIQFGTNVTALESSGHNVRVYTMEGSLEADQVVVATDPPELRRLLGVKTPQGHVGSSYVYFASDALLDQSRKLILASDEGLINNAMWLSNVGPFAPSGKHLLSVSVLRANFDNDNLLMASVLQELEHWYGAQAGELQLLKIIHIPYGQFVQNVGFMDHLTPIKAPLERVWIASEATRISSIQGAMESGEQAAAAILGDVQTLSRPLGG